MSNSGIFDFLGSEAIPFYASFAVPQAFAFPPGFDVAVYSGLTVCHLISAPPDQRLVSYWRDELSYRAYEASFRSSLCLEAPDRCGPVICVQRQTEVWWKPKSLSAALLAIAATFGAATALRDYFGDLFALPATALAYADAGHVDQVEGDPAAIPLTVSSGVRFATEHVRLEPPLLVSKQRTLATWKFDAPDLPALSAALPQKVSVIGIAPAHSGRSGPDIYSLRVSSQAEAGLLTGLVLKGGATAPDKDVWVWAGKAAVSDLRVARVADTLCELSGSLNSPRADARGLTLESVAVGSPGELFSLSVSAPGWSNLPPEFSPNETAFAVAIRSASVEKFRQYPFRVFLQGKKAFDQGSCAAWLGRLRVSIK